MKIISNTYFICTIFKKGTPFVLTSKYKLLNNNLWGQVKIDIILLYLHNIWLNDNHLCQITNNYKDYVMAIFDNVENALKFHLTVFTDGRPHFVVK